MIAKGCIVARQVFLIFTTQIYQYLSVISFFALVSDEPEVFLPKYSQTAILHAAHFRWVVTIVFYNFSHHYNTEVWGALFVIRLVFCCRVILEA